MHIATDMGQIIQPAQKNNENMIFHIPANVKNINICSMASRPSDVVRPFVDDRCNLGVLIGDITVITNYGVDKVKSHITDKKLHGRHAVDQSSRLRWFTIREMLC